MAVVVVPAWLGVGARIVAVWLLAWLAQSLARVAIDRWANLAAARHRTMAALARSSVRYVVDFIAMVAVLQLLGVPTGSVLAGAGLLGLAFSFGAQGLVRDFLSGLFILYEDQFAVGDSITVATYVGGAGVSGTVEDVGLRITRLRTGDGSLVMIPNGSIAQVVNSSRGPTTVRVTVTVPFDCDPDAVAATLSQVAAAPLTGAEGAVQVAGPTELGANGAGWQLTVSADPAAAAMVRAELGRRVLTALRQAGIRVTGP